MTKTIHQHHCRHTPRSLKHGAREDVPAVGDLTSYADEETCAAKVMPWRSSRLVSSSQSPSLNSTLLVLPSLPAAGLPELRGSVFILHVPARRLLEDAPSVERKGLGLRGLVIVEVGGHKCVVQGRFGVL